MAILKAVAPKKAKAKLIQNICAYVLKNEKTEEKLTYGFNVDVKNCVEQMNNTKDFWDKKNKGREYYHFVQAFPPNENITTEQALEMAKKFIQKSKAFEDFEVLLATHKDKKHIHTHFIVNSVSLTNGKKFRYSKNDLANWKELQDTINIQNGFSKAVEKGQTIQGTEREETVANNRDTFEILKKAEKGQAQSYVWDCALAVINNTKKSKNKIEFIELMKASGYKTKWEDHKKHITFTDIEREKNGEQKKSVRLSKLFDYFNISIFESKEKLLNEFERNSERTTATQQPGTNPKPTQSNTDIFAEYQQHRADERAEAIRIQNARQLAAEQQRQLEKDKRKLQPGHKKDFSIGR